MFIRVCGNGSQRSTWLQRQQAGNFCLRPSRELGFGESGDRTVAVDAPGLRASRNAERQRHGKRCAGRGARTRDNILKNWSRHGGNFACLMESPVQPAYQQWFA
jgi:hypothetical protein